MSRAHVAAGTDGPAYLLDGVAKGYGGVPALEDVSLRIEPGETVALVGPSGAGKTTLLRLCAGMLAPSTGALSLFGRSPSACATAELTRLVGIMQQRLDLVAQLSVKHNVQAGLLGRWGVLRSLASLILPLEEPAARDAVARVGIADKLTTRVAWLSGGEQQRVAVARLLVQDPQVLLVDEPVSSLDPARADDLVGLLAGLARESGRTLVASLHTPVLAARHFDRVVGLRDGRVAFDQPAHELSPETLDWLYRLLAPVDGTAEEPGAAAG